MGLKQDAHVKGPETGSTNTLSPLWWIKYQPLYQPLPLPFFFFELFFELFFSLGLSQVIDIICNDVIPTIRRSALSGISLFNTENTPLLPGPR